MVLPVCDTPYDMNERTVQKGEEIYVLQNCPLQASYMILDDEDAGLSDNAHHVEEEASHSSSVPNFPRPSAREYILRTIVPRPAPFSRTLPQRMYCCIDEDDFRLAGAFSSDTVFQ